MGFVIINPFYMTRRAFGTLTLRPIRFSSGGYLGTVINTDSTVVGVEESDANSDYDVSENAVSARVVSAGLRVSYAGTELNRGGTIVGIEDPNHLSLNGFSEPAMLQFDKARLDPATRAWHTIVYSPKVPLEVSYIPLDRAPDLQTQATVQANTFAETVLGNPFCMAFIVSGAAANTPYKFEACVNAEFVGEAVRGKSDSKADPIGYSAVRDAIPQGPYVGPPNRSVMDALKEASINLSEMVGSYVGSTEGRKQLTQTAGQLYTMYKGMKRGHLLEL